MAKSSNTERVNKRHWEAFRDGELLESEELAAMLRDLEAALPLLHAYGDYSTLKSVLLDRAEVTRILRERGACHG